MSSTPTSYTSAGSAKSYAVNVNRSKTQKWANAKPVDYGGDDWGAEYDDDEEEEEEEEPAPAMKPTGLRQKGQAMQNSVETEPKTYGDLPNLQQSSASSSVARKNSFDQGDEKRSFSSGGPAITGSAATAQRAVGPSLHISTTQPATGLRKSSVRKPIPQSTQARSDSQSDYTPMTAATSTSAYSQDDGFQTRRDYSPSAAPFSSVPQSSGDQSTANFPPRKSSLSQQIRPNLSNRTSADSAAKPWTETTRSSSPSTAARISTNSSTSKPWNADGSHGMPSVRSPTSPSSTEKPLPFVRPADIYKRMVEEKERERQSLDSSRQSMESLDPSNPNKSLSAAIPTSQGKAGAEGPSQAKSEGGAESDTSTLRSKGLIPMLAPVKERKSEYGFDSFLPPNTHSREPSDATQTSRNEAIDESRFSRSPELPDFNRMSGFGDDLFSPIDIPNTDFSGSSPTSPTEATGASQPTLLRTEPSLGFRTAVNTAFENANSVPPTPSSHLGSNLARSDSESTGTTGISPIMSRAPSGAMEARSREAEARGANTPAIAEVMEPDSRPQSAATPASIVTAGGVLTSDDDGLTPPLRPRAERNDSSFRPALPGGWNSYATTASESEPQAAEPVSPVHESAHEDSQDLTPTISVQPVHDAEDATEDSPIGRTVSVPEAQHSHSPIDGVLNDYHDDLPSPKPLNTKTNTNLSTESRPSDDETDRLRKEIVKSLTPKNSDVGSATAPAVERDVRESYYLPSEYDNYWNEQDNGPPSEKTPTASNFHEPGQSLGDIASIPPLASRKVAKSPEPQPAAERRFSWEAGGEQVKYLSSEVQGSSPAVRPLTPTATSDVSQDKSLKDANLTASAIPSSGPEINVRPESASMEKNACGSKVYLGEESLAPAGISAAAPANKDAALEIPNISLPGSDEKSAGGPLSSSPISPLEYQSAETPPQSATTSKRASTFDNYDSAAPEISHTQRLSLPQSAAASGEFTVNTTLKDILKIQDPYHRIRACGEVQTKLATADTDLAQWLATVKSENPEYADIDGNFGGSVPFTPVASSTRSKFSKALSPSSNTLQQPYYQQYLNASSPTSAQPPPPQRTGSSAGYTPSSAQQGSFSGFSGGGSKISTQQVQAKSKELLHTAGVFGGKGMKAGKGLLAKGKSRFSSRGGAADKISSDDLASTNAAAGARRQSNASNTSGRASFGHRRLNTVDSFPKSTSRFGRASEDSIVVDEVQASAMGKDKRRTSAFGWGSGAGGQSSSRQSSRWSKGGLTVGTGGVAGRLKGFGRLSTQIVRGKEKDTTELPDPPFTPDLRGVHSMHLKPSSISSPSPPVLPAILLNSNDDLDRPVRSPSIDSTDRAAREEYHRHRRNESGQSNHSGRSGSALSGRRPDMTFFLADDVSDVGEEGSVSYGESDENVSYGVAKPAPISKFQPTWDPYLASPILEGEEESPIHKYGANLVKLSSTSTAPTERSAVDPSGNVEISEHHDNTSREMVSESPVIGVMEVDSEPEDWVMVGEDAMATTSTASPPPLSNQRPELSRGFGLVSNMPPPLPPRALARASEVPPPPVSDEPQHDDSTSLSNVHIDKSGPSSTEHAIPVSNISADKVEHVKESSGEVKENTPSRPASPPEVSCCLLSAEPNHYHPDESAMNSTEHEAPFSGISSDEQFDESPIIPMPLRRFVSTEAMTPEEVESPIIPQIFRTIKGDPTTQYARGYGSTKPKEQDSPKFSLPPIKRGTSFGSLINGWPGVLSRSTSKSSKVSSRRYQIDADSDAEPEVIPPMPPTPAFARPGTSDSAKRAMEKMKTVSVADSDEFSQPEENATIGALIAAGLVHAAFGDERPGSSLITPHESTPATSKKAEYRLSTVDSVQLGSEKKDLTPELASPVTQGSLMPKQKFEQFESHSPAIEPFEYFSAMGGWDTSDGRREIAREPLSSSNGLESTAMDSVVLGEENLSERPSTPIQDSNRPLAALLASPEGQPLSPQQSTTETLVDESRAPDRLSKSSEQWAENAPTMDNYKPANHPSSGQQPPDVQGNLGQPPHTSEEVILTREQRRSQRPDVRIDTTPSSSPGLSGRATFGSSPFAHRSLPSYESPKLYVPPTVARQTYSGVGPMQGVDPESSSLDRELDLPEHLYQAPLTKDESFLPRQQTSEYQVAGLGPPDEVPQSATSSSRRSSAFFKEIGGRLSRTKSLTLEEMTRAVSPGSSRNNKTIAHSVSSVTSDDIREKMRNQSRRSSSFFGLGPGSLSRTSTNAKDDPASPRVGNGYVGGNNGESYTNVGGRNLVSPTPGSPLAPVMEGDVKEKRSARAFFGNVTGRPTTKPTVPMLNVLAEPVPKEKSSRRPRFSRLKLGELLGRGGKSKESILEENPPPLTGNSITSIQQTPIEYRPRNKSLGQLPILARPFAGRLNKNPRADENKARATSEERERQRKEDAHALLTGPLPPAYTPPTNEFDFEDTQDDNLDRDPEKEDYTMHLHPAHRPTPKLTPIFIEEFPDRGRKKNKELQYDAPPIPGAYDLVRGDGNAASPTNYDPRGYNRRESGVILPPASYINQSPILGPEHSQSPPLSQAQQRQIQVGIAHGSPPSSHLRPQAYPSPREESSNQGFRRPSTEDSPPYNDSVGDGNMGLIQGPDGRIAWRTARRNVSREDLLARSPARPIFGQQRPYQLSLPEEEEAAQVRDYSSGSVRSGSASTENRDTVASQTSPQGLGLGVGGDFAVKPTHSHGRNMSADVNTGKSNHLGLHPELKKRPESEQSWHPLPADGIFETSRDIGVGKRKAYLSPNVGAQEWEEEEKAKSLVSEVSKSRSSPPLRTPTVPERNPRRSFENTNLSPQPSIRTSPIPSAKASPKPSPNLNYHTPSHNNSSENIDPYYRDIYNASPDNKSRNTNSAANASGSGVKGKGIRNEMEPEEKIVDVYNQGRGEAVELSAMPLDEDRVVMSATSYPGMEWNPYAEGEGIYDYGSD